MTTRMISLPLWVWRVEWVEWVLKERGLERFWEVEQVQKVEWVGGAGGTVRVERAGQAGGVELVGEVEWVERAGQAGEVEWVEWAGQAEAEQAELAATHSLEGYTERTASATSSSRDDYRVGAESAWQASRTLAQQALQASLVCLTQWAQKASQA